MAVTQVNPGADAGMENWDIRATQIRAEEQDKLDALEEDFRETPEYTQLSNVVADKNILNAIVTAYTQTDENLEQAIRFVFTDTTTTTRLGLDFGSPSDATQAAETLILEMTQVAKTDDTATQNPEGQKDTPEPLDEAGIEQEKIDTSEIPGMPTLQRLTENGIISPKDTNDITAQVQQGKTLTDSISLIITDAGQREKVLGFFQVEEPEERAENFFEDMPDIVSADREHPTLQLIAENYTKIPGIDGNEASAEDNFKTAVQEAANKVVDGKVFERTEGFQRAMDVIKLGKNKEDVFKALGEVHQYVNNYTGMRGRASSDKLRMSTKRKVQAEKIQETTFGELIAKAKQYADTKQQDRIEKVMAARKAEEDDTVTTGDLAIGGGLLDMIGDSPETQKKAV